MAIEKRLHRFIGWPQLHNWQIVARLQRWQRHLHVLQNESIRHWIWRNFLLSYLEIVVQDSTANRKYTNGRMTVAISWNEHTSKNHYSNEYRELQRKKSKEVYVDNQSIERYSRYANSIEEVDSIDSSQTAQPHESAEKETPRQAVDATHTEHLDKGELGKKWEPHASHHQSNILFVANAGHPRSKLVEVFMVVLLASVCWFSKR